MRRATRAQHGEVGGASSLSSSDRNFIMKAAQGGMAEVELGQLASQRASDPQVKQFAERMVADHGKANDQLKQIASSKNVTLPTDVPAAEKRSAIACEAQRRAVRPRVHEPHDVGPQEGHEPLPLRREVREGCGGQAVRVDDAAHARGAPADGAVDQQVDEVECDQEREDELLSRSQTAGKKNAGHRPAFSLDAASGHWPDVSRGPM
jgi:hypothetical protein